MRYRIVAGRVALTVGALAMLGLAAACGGGDEATESAKSAVKSAVTVGADGAATITARDNSFTPKALAAPANQPVKLTLDNKGAAIHNWAVAGQNGPDGKEIQTALIPAGQQGIVEFSLPAGTYDFYCPVHPVEMRGKLTVS